MTGYFSDMIASALIAAMLSLAAPNDPLSEVPCAFLPAFFNPGSATLGENEIRLFASGYLADFGVIANPRSQISIAGIATDGGSEAGNRLLVERREQTVRDLLVARGMRPDQISVGPRERMLSSYPLDSTNGRAVVIEVRIPNSDLVRVMPPGGPIC